MRRADFGADGIGGTGAGVERTGVEWVRSERAMVLLYDPRSNTPCNTSKLISKLGRNSL